MTYSETREVTFTPSRIRTIAMRFLTLPVTQRDQVMRELGVLQDGETMALDATLEEVFRRVRDRKLLSALEGLLWP